MKRMLKLSTYYKSRRKLACSFRILYFPAYEIEVMASSGHRLIWWGGMRRQFAMNPMLHRTIIRKSITFAYVQLRGNKSKIGFKKKLE